jgi:ribonuclease Z
LHLYATPALKEVLDLMLKVSGSRFCFEFIFHPITETGILLDLPEISVACFPVAHRIACWGFLFTVKEKPERLKDGECLRPATPALRYAYCADTRYDESILEHVSGCNLMYHETTYLDDQAEKAEARFHSTSTQAATIALKANTGRLLLGHFSSKYPDLSPFETEARQTFPASEISREGVTYLVKSLG